MVFSLENEEESNVVTTDTIMLELARLWIPIGSHVSTGSERFPMTPIELVRMESKRSSIRANYRAKDIMTESTPSEREGKHIMISSFLVVTQQHFLQLSNPKAWG